MPVAVGQCIHARYSSRYSSLFKNKQIFRAETSGFFSFFPLQHIITAMLYNANMRKYRPCHAFPNNVGRQTGANEGDPPW